jgi:hypothetical protein
MGAMEEKKVFYQLLKPVRRQLIILEISREFHYWLTTSFAFAVLLLAVARMMAFPFYHRFIWGGCLLLLLVHGIRVWRRVPDWKRAALLFNLYVPDDRVTTALSFIDSDGIIEKLQLKETLSNMKREQQRVLTRKKNFLLAKWLLIALLLGCTAVLLSSLPNDNLQLATKKETETKVMKKVKKELAKKTEREQNSEEKKVLQQAQEIITKYPEPKKAFEELAKQKKELELKTLKAQEKQETLKAWQHELKNNDLAKLAAALEAQDIEKIMDELERLNKNFSSLTVAQKQAIAKMSGMNKTLTERELAELAKKISEVLNSETNQKQLLAAQSAIEAVQNDILSELAANGLPTNQLASSQATGNTKAGQSVTNGQSQTGSPGKSQGQQGTNNGSKSGTGSSGQSGNGTGSGNGSASGSGSGSGSGQGSGTGTGTGNGAGFGAGSRQLLTVPEKQAGEDNLETDTGSLSGGSPAEQYQGNGPVLPGQLRPYQEVYSSYLDAYRNSQDRVKLPADLEEIVKNYFLSLDPNRE